MPLNLHDLIKKAEAKGYKPTKGDHSPAPSQLFRPWQQESVLFEQNLPESSSISTDNEEKTGKTTEQANKTDHKPDTNRAQTEHKTEHKVDTNKAQTEHKNRKELDTKTQTEHKVDTKVNTKTNTKWIQTDHKLDTNNSFSSLIGLQRAIVVFFYEHCKILRSKVTEPISIEHIAKHLNIKVGSVKTTVRRLQEKNFLNRIEFKNGRGGWSKYEVPNHVFSELMQLETGNKLNTNWTQTRYKINTEPDTEIDTRDSSSSGSIINNKTTTTGTNNNSAIPHNFLSEEWIKIDIEPLSTIGFTQTHLSQIASQNKLQPQIVQESINAFAFDLIQNNRAKTIKGDPINFFMGILRNGKPYAPPSNYESPEDKAMRIYLERMREIERKRTEGEKEAFNLAFNDWFLKLSPEQKREFLPLQMRRNVNLETSKLLENTAKRHFEKEIWELKKLEIMES